MGPQELRSFLHHQPFRPFRITLTDGRHYDVVHPKLALVGRTAVVIGLPVRNDRDQSNGDAAPPIERHVTVSLLHIMQVDELEEADKA